MKIRSCQRCGHPESVYLPGETLVNSVVWGASSHYDNSDMAPLGRDKFWCLDCAIERNAQVPVGHPYYKIIPRRKHIKLPLPLPQ